MADLDMTRARRLMAERHLDGLVVVKPENVQYVSGVHPGPASSLWRRAGPAVVLLPADEAVPPAAIVPDTQEAAFRQGSAIADLRTHPLWIEIDDVTDLSVDGQSIEKVIHRAAARRAKPRVRPGTYDTHLALSQLADAVHERGLADQRLGIELDFIAVNDMRAFQEHLPRATFVDSSRILAQLRAVKSQREIEALRLAVQLSEAGIEAGVQSLQPGMAAAEVALAYRTGVIAAARRRGSLQLESTWDIISVGRRPWGEGLTTARVDEGALVKFDVGCIVAGAESDIGRTFVVGRASDAQRRVHEALVRGHEAARAMMWPGVPICSVFQAALDAIRGAGLSSYTRGHFGHSLGSDFGHEEWPYIEAAEDCRLEPGMVFALETPYYVDGFGGYITEDNILITEHGHDTMNTLSHALLDVRPDGAAATGEAGRPHTGRRDRPSR